MPLFVRRLAVALFVALVAGPAAAQVGFNQGLLDPDLATPTELAGIGLSPAQVDAVLAGRPFADMLAVDAVLGLDDAARDAIYARMFLPLNLTTTTAAGYGLIPGVSDEAAAEMAEAYRAVTSLDEFRAAFGTSADAAEVARVEQYVFAPMDLNSAREEDYATIPGMDDRMIDEFLEYRPYTAIQQFRVEIGKYVDDDEVARLERYVTIR